MMRFLNSEKNYKQAVIHLTKAFKINPNSSKLNFNLALSYKGIKNFEKAVEHYNKTLELNPKYYQSYNHLSSIYYDQNLYFEAVNYVKKAIEFNPEYVEGLNNYGVMLRDLGFIEKSEIFLKKAVNLNPNYHTAIWNLAITKLSQENYKEGWLGFNSRWLNPNLNQNQNIFCNKPIWNGSEIGNLLIWSEQGIGDQIMFSRFFKFLTNYKGEVFAILNPKLEIILKESFPHINFVDKLEQDKFDFHLPIASFGEIFINNKEDLFKNSSSYLVSKKCGIKNKIKISTKKNFLIGISWKSVNDQFGDDKSIKLSELKDILNIPNVTFINLQYGDVNDEIKRINKEIKNEIKIIKDIDMLNDIQRMGSVINELDLVVTISNSTAHLSGAIGKDTILMLSKGKGNLWYWIKGDDKKAKWYSSIEIIQQDKINLWNNVLIETKNLIEKKIKQKKD